MMLYGVAWSCMDVNGGLLAECLCEIGLASGDEELDDRDVLVGSGDGERGDACGVEGVDVCSVLDKSLDDVKMAFPCGQMEGRGSVFELDVDVSGNDEELDDPDVAKLCAQGQGSPPSVTRGKGFRPDLEEPGCDFDLVFLGGKMEGPRVVVLQRSNLCACLDQDHSNVLVSQKRRQVERSAPSAHRSIHTPLLAQTRENPLDKRKRAGTDGCRQRSV